MQESKTNNTTILLCSIYSLKSIVKKSTLFLWESHKQSNLPLKWEIALGNQVNQNFFMPLNFNKNGNLNETQTLSYEEFEKSFGFNDSRVRIYLNDIDGYD